MLELYAQMALDAWVDTVIPHRNIANDRLTHDPELTPEQIDEALALIAQRLSEYYRARFEALGGKGEGARTEAVPWDDPIPLDDPALAEMPRGLCAPWVDRFIEALAAATETPRELALLMTLGAIATSVQRKARVAIVPGYAEPLNIWALAGLESGNRKTQVILSAARSSTGRPTARPKSRRRSRRRPRSSKPRKRGFMNCASRRRRLSLMRIM